MRWRLEFYHQRRGLLAHYSVEAPLPAAAGLAGWDAVLAEHPPGPAPRRPSLLARAERIGGQHSSGWVLYRIANDNRPASSGIAPMDAVVGSTT
jgi:hypothetical protein